MNISVDSDMHLRAPVHEITGTPEHFMRMFAEASRRYGKVRIAHDPTWGVRIEFTGHWMDNVRIVDGDELLRRSREAEAMKRALAASEIGYLGRFWRWLKRVAA